MAKSLRSGGAHLSVRRRLLPRGAFWRVAKRLLSAGLVVLGLVGGAKLFLFPAGVGALDFTAHIIGVETGAVGVLGIGSSDLDGDDDIDIVTVGLDGIKVYINDGSESFTVDKIDDKEGERVQIIDLDEDGDSDLLVTMKSTSPAVVWYVNNGDMEFSATSIGDGDSAKAYAGDIDADGDNDIITAWSDGGEIDLIRWMNDGSGNFTATTMEQNSGVMAVAVGDIDGNGYPDIIVGGTKGLQRWNSTDGYSWSRSDIDESLTSLSHLAVGDVNGDGKEDVVAGVPSSDTVYYYRNIDLSSFDKISLEGSSDAVTVEIRDLDEDGNEDIVVAGQDDNAVYWYRNDGSDFFTKKTIVSGLQSVFGVIVSDIDGDDDFDLVAGDHFQGNVHWYERVRAKPVATAADEISQSTDGEGVVSFKVTVSDADNETTRMRVLYSVDGSNWYKPWLTEVRVSNGSVNLKNSDGYQIGTSNAIDTDSYSSVALTLKWDTQSTQNTGGAITGDVGTVKIRIIPRDGTGDGLAADSSQFRVDNGDPVLGEMKVVATQEKEIELGWGAVSDSSDCEYFVYYGTDSVAVLDKSSSKWDEGNDAALSDKETTGTTITNLESGKEYSFLLCAKDDFGNETCGSVLSAVVGQEVPVASTSPGSSILPTPEESTAPSPESSSVPVESPGQESGLPPSSEIEPQPSQTGPVFSPPSVTNLPQPSEEFVSEVIADAGEDQLVNPDTLVILDGTKSRDTAGTSLTYTWRQISGPMAQLSADRTATPSFKAWGENKVYVFALTVKNLSGRTAADSVTVATRSFPEEGVGEVGEVEDQGKKVAEVSRVVRYLLWPLDIFLLGVSVWFIGYELVNRFNNMNKGRLMGVTGVRKKRTKNVGKVVHYRTGEPVMGARVVVYTKSGKKVASRWTNTEGEFSWNAEAGKFLIRVKSEGLSFSPPASSFPAKEGAIIYSGGEFAVDGGDKPVRLVIPMKPTSEAAASSRMQLLKLWQIMQKQGHLLFWPFFTAGAIDNTVLLLWIPGSVYLIIEVVYILLVIIKIILEAKRCPSYGLVRDAITRVPIDLAVVRLYEQGTNKLVLTRVTNGQGKFFALPPPGVYTITVTKPGYAAFTQENIKISPERDSVLQIKANIMPMAPNLGLAGAM